MTLLSFDKLAPPVLIFEIPQENDFQSSPSNPIEWRWWLADSHKIINDNLCLELSGEWATPEIQALRELLRTYRPFCVFLSEKRKTPKYLDHLRIRFQFQNAHYVNPTGFFEGLSLWWFDPLQLEVLKDSIHFIHTKVTSSPNFFASFIYGEPNNSERAMMWAQMDGLGEMVSGA